MLGGFLVILVSAVIATLVIGSVRRNHPSVDGGLLQRMFFYHVFLTIVYYLYALFNASDSAHYYAKVVANYRGENWMDYYGTSTTFIEFIAFPFIKFFGFSYEAMMVLFSFFGYLGFVYFYIFFRKNVRFKHTFMGFDLLTLFFFLPNLHFWSASLGKGSMIFLGLGLYFYSISNVRSRIIPLLISGFIIYHVRPHIMLVVLVSSAIGFVFSTRGVSATWRVVFLAGASVALFFIYSDVLTLVGINEDAVLTQGLDLTHRASELGKATSGVDISNYSLPMQLFTFLYRPLFFDAPGVLGLIVSFENVFYLLMTFRLLGSTSGWKFLFTGGTLAKSAFFSFLTVSIALAQVSGNLGLAMRQKSQVMILLLFVVIQFLDTQKYAQRLLETERAKRMRAIGDAATKLQVRPEA
jgi:hypothetical protein